MSSVRRPPFVLVAIVAVLLVGLRPAPAGSAEPVLVIDGKGDGHGVGMSQDGALAMGRAGMSTDEILAKFYPGTVVGTAGGVVGVRILESDATVIDVSFPDGGEVRASPIGPQPEGFPLRVTPGGTATLSLDDGTFRAVSDDREETEAALGGFRLIADEVESTTTSSTPADETTTSVPEDSTPTSTTTSTSTTTTTTEVVPTTTSTVGPPGATESADGLWLVPPDGAATVVEATGRRYRGAVEVGASAAGGIELVDHVDVEDYLRGMGEVLDASWPPAALRAQAVAARTYALRATQGGGTLCDDDRCQVYLGAGVEYGAMDEAVAESAGEVLTYGGGLASTVYSSSGGGVTATPREGFGTDGTDFPYLVAGPYAAPSPPVWAVSIALADLGPRVGYPGRIREATVAESGPSGRALEVALDGDAGRRMVDGLRFASALDLHSTLFSVRPAVGTPTPPAPPGRPSIQALPDAAVLLPPLRTVALAGPRTDGGPAADAVRSLLLLAAAGCLLAEHRRRRVRLLAR